MVLPGCHFQKAIVIPFSISKEHSTTTALSGIYFLLVLLQCLCFWNLHTILSWMMYSTGWCGYKVLVLVVVYCCQAERESERKQTNVFHTCYISSDWQLWWHTPRWDPEHGFSILTCQNASFLSEFWFTSKPTCLLALNMTNHNIKNRGYLSNILHSKIQ